MNDVAEVDAVKEERLQKIWEGDKLGRRADADYLIRFLTRRIEERGEQRKEKSYVLNIDSQWGGGKTFFLDHFASHLKEEGYVVARVNAWEDDYVEDPLISVMAAIEAEMGSLLEESEPLRSAWKEVRKYAGPIVSAYAVGSGKFVSGPIQKFTGVNPFEVVQVWRKTRKQKQQASETIIDRFVQVKSEVGGFKEAFSIFLKKLDKKKKVPFYILVDEMDRCRPPYAIALLERVKHLFNIDNVVFVFATDTEQLSHSIGAVYGAEFASRKYLHRFFDLTYKFPKPSVEVFVDHLLEINPISKESFKTPEDEEVTSFCIGCFKDFNLSLRDIEQCVDTLHNVTTGWVGQSKPLEGVVMLPLIVAHHLRINIHHPWGDGLLELFEPVMMGNKINGMGWRVAPPISKENEQTPLQKSETSCWDLFAAYINLSVLHPSGLSQRDIAGLSHPIKDWERSIINQLSSEYHAGKYTRSQDYMVRSYPDVIASAGRLGKA